MNLRMLAMTATLVMLWSATATAAASDGKNSTAQRPSVATGTETPAAVLPELKFEFGSVVDGTQVTHDFPVSNSGSGPLDITKVKTG